MFELFAQGPYMCVNCGHPNRDIYKIYGNMVRHHSRSPSTSAALMSNMSNKCTMTPRLSKCEQCHQLVDEYVQLDTNILYLDAILQRQSFFRHILLNCKQCNTKSVMKMALIIFFCEAFQRWSSINGVNFSCDKQTDQFPVVTHTYFHLEVSFYYHVFCVFTENVLFNLVFYISFKLFAMYRTKNREMPEKPTLWQSTCAMIICSYGKLFLIPSNLYAGELKPILDLMIHFFCFVSATQCAATIGHNLRMNRLHALVLITLTWLVCTALHSLAYAIIPSQLQDYLNY